MGRLENSTQFFWVADGSIGALSVPLLRLTTTSWRASARTPQTFRTSRIPFATMDVGIVEALCDYSRPVFLFGASFRRGVSCCPLRYPPLRSRSVGGSGAVRIAEPRSTHSDVRLETRRLIPHPSQSPPRAPQA